MRFTSTLRGKSSGANATQNGKRSSEVERRLEEVLAKVTGSVTLDHLAFTHELFWPVQRVGPSVATDTATLAGASESKSDDEVEWLRAECRKHKHSQGSDALPESETYASLVELLRSKSSDDELQGKLLDLLGFRESSFSLIPQILAKRKAVVRAIAASEAAQARTEGSFKEHGRVDLVDGGGIGTQLKSTTSASRVRLERSGGYVSPPQVGSRVNGRPAGTTEEMIEHTFLTGPGAHNPEENKTKYVLVHVPLRKLPHKPRAGELVPITDFSPLAQLAFKGIKQLNRVQSRVFYTAYRTNHNLLICAPTGAGKTNVAMTTVVHEIERHQDEDGNVDLRSIKMVYIAPMKALAQEVVTKFGKRLAPIGVRVRECTGDMQLTKAEIEESQLIVTTPEKWDVITRKSADGTLVERVGLLILDEVHLVGEDRGPVIESLIARTLRLVEQKQKMVRIVGLSATLPNYKDVARFLRVDLQQGLFFFDNSFRPVPLDQKFIGVNEKQRPKKEALMNDLAYEHALRSVRNGDQVMIFVHSRKETSKTVRGIIEAAQFAGNERAFVANEQTLNMKQREFLSKDVRKSRNAQVREFFDMGFGIHHAGMLRSDRNLVEKLFANKALSVLCCTATLAWGVNLPAHTVIIKGTQIYMPEKGGLTELSMQDVFQCFGRAGRPQFDTTGEAVLITEYPQLNRYLGMLNHAIPLESQLHKHLPDALNAEIVSGTITNLGEAIEWLSYTFLHVRMLLNPLQYGISTAERKQDPTLVNHRIKIIVQAARSLDSARMTRFAGGQFSSPNEPLPRHIPFGVTDLGRVASHYYIGYGTVEEFNAHLKAEMTDAEVLELLCRASEFSTIKVREEEMSELAKVKRQMCPIKVKDALDSPRGKTMVLLQAFFGRTRFTSFTLTSDMNYISSNLGRISRAVFEICLKRRWSSMTEKLLTICIAVDRQCWWPPYAHPLRQFCPHYLKPEICRKLEDRKPSTSLDELLEMTPQEVGSLIRHMKMGETVLANARRIPFLDVSATLQPLTRSILRVTLDIEPQFEWHDRIHGGAQSFWVWVEDQKSEWIYHSERIILRKKEFKEYMKYARYKQSSESVETSSSQDKQRHSSASKNSTSKVPPRVDMCLSMHQPWASLLVHGIKRAEGRSWGADYSGRLYIHAAAKEPEPELVRQVEEQYRKLYAMEGVKEITFPSSYPTRCLLGSVQVAGCITLENLKESEVRKSIKFESESPFQFLCHSPQYLTFPLSISGQHKLWTLPPSILNSVTAQGLTPAYQKHPPTEEFQGLEYPDLPVSVPLAAPQGEEEKEEKDAFARIMSKRQQGTHPALGGSEELSWQSLRREFTIPIFEPLPPQYFVRVLSDGWFGGEQVVPLSLNKIILPEKRKQHTNLLDLDPLPIEALGNPGFESLYRHKFSHFNPIQTQIFHVMYHTDHNVLLGAPTGSGKTISAEIALLRQFNKKDEQGGGKIVYIAPLKALVYERVQAWKKSLGEVLGKTVVELTGDATPGSAVLRKADVIITTPEKWDGVTRKWKDQGYVKLVRVVVIDEIHLLGEERGAIIEVIVTRMRYIAQRLKTNVRIIGLSTALANAHDLANWMGIKDIGLFNFRPAVRPVPLEVHIQGFPGKHYCPRMATMNKPAYASILTHSPTQPVLIFVASRRQTRLTAVDLISYCGSSDNPRAFLHMDSQEMQAIIDLQVKEETLKHTLEFGIGIHHAGLSSADREVVENLFVSGKIQVLVCTSTLAWGVNFPAHLVIIKGTEYYDAKLKRYQPFAVTDVLQMMGRAGRPQFDKSGVAMIFVQESLKDFYKKFLYEPFPVESRLPEFLHNHINAEIAAGSITCTRDAIDYISWTYFFRRLPMNPTFYSLEDNSPESTIGYLVDLVEAVLSHLEANFCIVLSEPEGINLSEPMNAITAKSQSDSWASKSSIKNDGLKNVNTQPTALGALASYFYLDFKTMGLFQKRLLAPAESLMFQALHGNKEEDRLRVLAKLLADCTEFAEVPVRHNEDLLNADLAKVLPWPPTGEFEGAMDSPHTKTFLLLQAYWKRAPVPIKDFVDDTKSILDQVPRVLNALIKAAAHFGQLQTVLSAIKLSQMTTQALWWDVNPLVQLPGIQASAASKMKTTLLKLVATPTHHLKSKLERQGVLSQRQVSSVVASVSKLPRISVVARVNGEAQTCEVKLTSRNRVFTLPFAARFVKHRQVSCWVILWANKDRLIHVENVLLNRETKTLELKFSFLRPEKLTVLVDGILGLDQTVTLK